MENPGMLRPNEKLENVALDVWRFIIVHWLCTETEIGVDNGTGATGAENVRRVYRSQRVLQLEKIVSERLPREAGRFYALKSKLVTDIKLLFNNF
jgi:hypothetical protein